jgi:protein arginine kinase
VDRLSPLDRQFLVERQLITRQHAEAEGSRAVFVSLTEQISHMINESDHLRLQVIRSGLELEESPAIARRLHDELAQRLQFARHPKVGDLTARPSQAGSGFRVSVMLHLVGLELTRQIEKVLLALRKINLSVRGLYGERSSPDGHFYQIGFEQAISKPQEQILYEIREVVRQIITEERQARRSLLRDNLEDLRERHNRALLLLRSATMLTTEVMMESLSLLRMRNPELGNGIPLATVNELFVNMQPAHLQKLAGSPLDGEERNAIRAHHVRTRLSGPGWWFTAAGLLGEASKVPRCNSLPFSCNEPRERVARRGSVEFCWRESPAWHSV